MVVSKDAKRKRKEIIESSPEMPKRTKVQAQRKFAQGQYPPPSAYSYVGASSSSTSAAAAGNSQQQSTDANREPPPELIKKRPTTDDFLTFLCYRGSNVLPPHLDFLNENKKKNEAKTNLKADTNKTSDKQKDNGPSTSKASTPSTSKNEMNNTSLTANENKKDNKNITTLRKGKNSTNSNLNSTEIMPFAVRKRAAQISEGNKKLKNVAGNIKNKSTKDTERRSLRGRPRINFEEHDEDDFNGDFDEDIPDETNKNAVNNKADSAKIKKKVNKKPIENNVQAKKEIIQEEKKKDSMQLELEVKKSPGKRGPKPKIKEVKSESDSFKKSVKEQPPIPVVVPQEQDSGTGRMTRQRAFFEPVKVLPRQPSVEKNEAPSKEIDADEEKVDFSSEDEKPLKSVKANGKKKPGRKSNSPNKVSPKKQNIKPEKIKEPENTNESNSKIQSEACKNAVQTPKVAKAKGRPRLKVQSAEKELVNFDQTNQTNVKNNKAKVKKNNQQKNSCIESGDEESVDKNTTETPTAIVTETPPKKKRGRKRGADADISQQSQTDFSENETARTGRPTRKTKEAATIYMELIGQKLHDFDDEDSFSMDSFPELPNVREMEKVENELKKNVGKQKTISPLNKTNIENKKEEKILLPKTVSPLTAKKRGPKKKAPIVPVTKKPKVEKKLTKKQQKLHAETAKASKQEEGIIEEDEDDILLKAEVKETKRKLEKSFSDSDDEPLAIKVTKTSEKDFDMSKDNEPKTNGETTKSTLKAPLLQQSQSPQATSTPNNSAKWHQVESSPVTQPQSQKLQLITSPTLLVPPKITSTNSSAIKSPQQNSVAPKHISPSNNFSTPSPVHVETYPSPKINPTFLTPKFDRNLERRVVTTPSLTIPDSQSVTSFNAQKNHSSFASISSAGAVITGNSSSKLANTTQNFAFANSFNVNTSNSVELATQQQNSKSNSPTAVATGGAGAGAGGGGDANSPNAIANLLAANLMPSKEESGKIFGIASVTLAQSSGPDNTKCTLGKCGSIHKPVLGPVVPTESYLGEQQLSSKERRKAKVNMTHEQIQKWLIECSSSPDQIQDDLDDDFDEVLKPATFAPTPPPLFRDDPALAGINLLSKAAATLKDLPSVGANAGKTTPTQKEGNSSWAGKGPSLKATPMVKDGDYDSLKQDVDEESVSEKKQNLNKKVKKKLDKKEQLKEKQDQLREKLEAKERENQEKLKAKLEKEKLEKELLEKEKLERLRAEKEKLERIEKERIEKERSECLEKEKQEKERLEKEKQEKDRLEKEKVDKEKVEKDKLDKLDKQAKQKEKKEKTKPNIVTKKVAKTPMKKTTQKNQLKFEKQLQKVVAKTTSPTKLKRTPVYTSKQQCNSKSESLNNTFGAFSPDNEKSVYSFDKEDDDILVPLSKPFRRQSRRDSHNEDDAKKITEKPEPSVNKSSSVTLSTTENSKLIKMNMPTDSNPEPTTTKRKPKNTTVSTPASAPIKDTKSTTSEFVLNDSEGETFYIPLQGTDVAGLAGQAVEVKVKVGREGPDGPNQKVCVQATLVTKSQISTASTSVENEKTNVSLNKDSPKTRVINEAGSSRTLQRVNSNSSLFSGSNKSRGTPNVPANVPKKLKDDMPIKIYNNTAFPHRDDPSQMVEAPVFRPTEKEFHDPMEFIDRITPIAARFGICKIIPPASFKPECRVSDDMRFSAYNQYVHKMLYRWGPSVKELNAIKKHCTTQRVSLTPFPLIGQIEVDLPRLYHTVQELGGLQEVMEKKKWNRVADEMCIPKLPQDRATRLDDIYCKYLLPYDTLSTTERQKLFDEVEADWAKREARARRNADHCLNSETDSNEEEEDEVESSEDSDEDPADGVSMECIVKGKTMSLKQFFRIARNQMSLWFKNTEPTTAEVEAEFWRHVAVRDSHVCVHSGSIDSSGWGYGFPIPKGKGSPCARHAWNLKVLTNNQGSVLRSLGPVMGVTVPTLHVGMLFSACCWYRDPHGLSWIEYLHTGASKIWYGIPDEQSSNFRKALTQLIPTHCQNKTIWLPCDTVMVPPHMLTDRGVSLCRIEQKPGEFVVIFPRAYTSSLSAGYVVSESVYFATSSWLDLAKEDFKDIHDSCEPAMFSLEQLLFAVASDTRVSVDILTQCLPMLEEVIAKEEAAREQLKATGVKSIEKVYNNKSKKKLPQFTDDDNECDLCRANLFISMIKTNDNNIYCLQHALKNLNKGNILADHCKLIFTHSIKDIQDLIKNVKNRLTQKNKSISHSTGKKK